MNKEAEKPNRFCSPGLKKTLVRLGFVSVEEIVKLSSQFPKRKIVWALAGLESGKREGAIIEAIQADLGIASIEFRGPKQLEQIRKSGLIAQLDEQLLLEHRCLPIEKQGEEIITALADPLDLETISQLEFALSAKVKPRIAKESEILQALDRIVGFQQAASIEVDSEDESELDLELAIGEVGMTEEVGSATAPVVKFVNQILMDAHSAKASDIHLEPSSGSLEVRYRVDGMMCQQITIPKRLQSYVTARVKILSGMDITEKRRPQDGRFRMKTGTGGAIDVRASTVPTVHGEKVVLRLLRSDIDDLSVAALRMPQAVETAFNNVLKSKDRILLVCGPTGSGKTTSLYSALNDLREAGGNIITIEDPIEIRLEGTTQIQVDSKIGMSFATGLRSVLRQDPDVILVGEIRDLETAEIAFQAAQTGHFVLSTLHTNSAASAVVRLIDLGLEPFIISSALGGVLAQRLLRKLCKECSTEADEVSLALGQRYGVEAASLRSAKGCEECEYTGFKGRIAAYSFLPVNAAVRELIRARASEDQIRIEARNCGMQDLAEAALGLVQEGITTFEEVERVVGLPDCSKKSQVPKQHVGVSAADFVSEKGSIADLATSYHQGQVAEVSPDKVRVLVVDDDDGVRAVVSRILKKGNFEVCEATNGFDALEKVPVFCPDIVVSDLSMPGMSGKDLLLAIRKDQKTNKLPVLMLTGSDDEKNEIELIGLGANDFVSKTASPGLVIARVNRLLQG